MIALEVTMRPQFKDASTYADLLNLPEGVVGELVSGQLFASPRPSNRHTLVSSALGGSIVGPFQFGRGGPGGWWILDEPELHLDADVLVPDLAGWKKERLPHIPDEPFLTLAPDWICEVLSPSTARLDRVLKLRKYAAARVAHVWLIDPLMKVVEVLRAQGDGWFLAGSYSGEDILRAEPFEAMELDLKYLWPP